MNSQLPTPNAQTVVAEAKGVIASALATARKPCITSSFQAECVVLTHMLLQERPDLPVLFLDTYDRMHYKSLFAFNPGKSRSVFLEEIPTKGLHIKDTKHLKEKVFNLMEAKLIEYRASWIKTEKMISD